eukprot:Skav206244  [mRNA]  locus=scaffold1425:132482:139635:- [translate_table: standard]
MPASKMAMELSSDMQVANLGVGGKSLQEIHGILQKTRAQVEAKKTELRELVGDHYRSVLESSDHIRAMSDCAVQVAQGAGKLDGLIGTMRELAVKPPLPDDNSEPETGFSLCEHVMELLEVPDKVRGFVAELSFVQAAKAALVDAPALHSQVVGGCIDAFAAAELTPAAAAEAFVAHLVLDETAASSLLRRFIDCRSNLLRDILEGLVGTHRMDFYSVLPQLPWLLREPLWSPAACALLVQEHSIVSWRLVDLPW